MTRSRLLPVPGVPGSGGPARPTTLMPGGVTPGPQRGPPSADGFTCLWAPSSHGSDPRSQINILTIKVRPIYQLLRRVMWTTSGAIYAQGLNGISAVRAPVTGAARCWNPQLLPVCAQDRRYFTQVIHRLVHIQRSAYLLPGSRAAEARTRLQHGQPARHEDPTWARGPQRARRLSGRSRPA